MSFMHPAERKLIASGSMRIRTETLRFFHETIFVTNKSPLQINRNGFRTPGGCHLKIGIRIEQENLSMSDSENPRQWFFPSTSFKVKFPWIGNKVNNEIYAVNLVNRDGILIACLGLTNQDLRAFSTISWNRSRKKSYKRIIYLNLTNVRHCLNWERESHKDP